MCVRYRQPVINHNLAPASVEVEPGDILPVRGCYWFTQMLIERIELVLKHLYYRGSVSYCIALHVTDLVVAALGSGDPSAETSYYRAVRCSILYKINGARA